MSEFPFARLRRLPDVEAPNLQAWDATDELLVARGVAEAAARGLRGTEIAVIGDGYGAITLALSAAVGAGIRVHQDLVTGRRALMRNAEALGISGFAAHEADGALLDGARLVLLQLPKGLGELEEIADAVARWAAPDVVLIAGGRVKHMTLAQNDVLARSFRGVQAQRAERKSRLVSAEDPLPVPEEPPFPVSAVHADVAGADLVVRAHGGAFAGARIDIGTRVLLETMDAGALAAPGPAVVDLGCGTGVLAAWFALRHPSASVIATDRSAAAVRSARATMAANGIEGRVRVDLDDAGSALPAGAADLILLNPPFHLGASVHEGAGRRLIDAAARLVRPGGEIWTVFNSGLDHRRALAAVGPTTQIHRTPKFTVTRSVRPVG
ncbi:16S rRNA (guanine1207-N2)-methyltransferase [Microbacterium resistens]|uniref:16S rRNA (Guanine1207-N2)-methyltransferase n=1 Tax=Microbacterium resistens TaxID=156977 RepID=A0ABU1SBD1_9MICO|nr:methyltransferase [Microbacterium resistens]MDR6866926.1 16S rRNA (guanine1207-N2)-methyltransferase [Microbacterium resistens]